MAKSKETSLIPTETGFEFVQDEGENKVLPLRKLALVSKLLGSEDSNQDLEESQFDFPDCTETHNDDQKK